MTEWRPPGRSCAPVFSTYERQGLIAACPLDGHFTNYSILFSVYALFAVKARLSLGLGLSLRDNAGGFSDLDFDIKMYIFCIKGKLFAKPRS